MQKIDISVVLCIYNIGGFQYSILYKFLITYVENTGEIYLLIYSIIKLKQKFKKVATDMVSCDIAHAEEKNKIFGRNISAEIKNLEILRVFGVR